MSEASFHSFEKDDINDNANASQDASAANGTATIDRAETAKKAKEYGWKPTTAYDYEALAAKPGDAAAVQNDEAASREASAEVNEAGEVVRDFPEWAANSAKYEWSDEYGEVGPKLPLLEAQLFQNDCLNRSGNMFDTYKTFNVTQEGPDQIRPILNFDDAGLHPVMLDNVKLCGYQIPTPIQAYTIPAVLMGRDVVACAQTGSGKTAAYFIPVLSKLMGKAKKIAAKRPNPNTFNPDTEKVTAEPLVLVVCPTRELAIQIFDEARRLCYRTMLRPCIAYGGGPTKHQREELQKGCDVLVATPGRLVDVMNQPSVLSLRRLKFTIIDEADELLQGDWEADFTQIMGGGDRNTDADHTYMMFSATFPKEARTLARQYMENDYIRIRVGRVGSTHSNIKQEIVWVEDSAKRQALYDLLFSYGPMRTLIFVNSKKSADLIDDYLYNLDLPSTSIHSDRTQREREDAIRSFRTGRTPIMVATNVMGRGLDVKNVMHVVNFDLPSQSQGGIEEYVHRIGRTARIGNEGLATSFYNSRNDDLAADLVKILLESKQKVPDFLEEHMPENGVVEWDDDKTDDENEGAKDEGDGAAETNGDGFGAATGGDAWGGADAGVGGGDAWGAANDDGAAAGGSW